MLDAVPEIISAQVALAAPLVRVVVENVVVGCPVSAKTILAGFISVVVTVAAGPLTILISRLPAVRVAVAGVVVAKFSSISICVEDIVFVVGTPAPLDKIILNRLLANILFAFLILDNLSLKPNLNNTPTSD